MKKNSSPVPAISYRYISPLLHYLMLAGVCLSAAACQQKNEEEYKVSGTLLNTAAQTVYLEENSPETAQPVFVDSATVQKNGRYQLSTLPKEETMYSLRLGGSRYPFVSFVNDSKEIRIDADFKKIEDPYSIKGSEGSRALKDFLFGLGQRINALKDITYTGDSIGYKRGQRDSIKNAINTQRNTAVKDIKNYTSDFVAGSKSAPLLLYALSSYQSLSSNTAFALEPFSETELQTIVGNAAKKFPEHKSLAAIQQQLQSAQAPQAVMTAPGFTLPDVNGQPVSLSAFKGKYVLVDFWASWCAPCRAENPNVVTAFQKFKDKNFTILGVSLDKEREPWIKAIAQDSLAWTHVSDLKYWDSMVVPLYNIEGIPYNVLLDTSGNIIARNLRGAALQQKLAEVLQ